ncbi:MAG: FAD binding domain-containing protein, partial [Actinomycetota bacterium]|nr:FAD binding domain-containing protein [Actinomycetota bacterium]
MSVLLPTSIDEAISALVDPDVQVLAGGTDFMVEVNSGYRRPQTVLSLTRIPELRRWQRWDRNDNDVDWVRVGAAVTYT